MCTGSSRGTGNETNFVMQKFARAVLVTTMWIAVPVCHGPSVAGLQVTLGNGAMSNSIADIEHPVACWYSGITVRILILLSPAG